MRSFLVAGAVVVGTALTAVGSCVLSEEGTLTDLVGTDAGVNTPCSSKDDCPQDTACVSYSCLDDKCAPNFAPAGTDVTGSVQGDCQKLVCSESGNPTPVADNTDLPNDGNECTVDSCDNGAPKYVAKSNGEKCGLNMALECQGGICTGCQSPNDCMGAPCKDPTCMMEQCGIMNTPAGVEFDDLNPDDCQHNVCDGMGNAVLQPDLDDNPDDNNTCTQDSCTMQGMPQHSPTNEGMTCGANMKCCGGSCIMGNCGMGGGGNGGNGGNGGMGGAGGNGGMMMDAGMDGN